MLTLKNATELNIFRNGCNPSDLGRVVAGWYSRRVYVQHRLSCACGYVSFHGGLLARSIFNGLHVQYTLQMLLLILSLTPTKHILRGCSGPGVRLLTCAPMQIYQLSVVASIFRPGRAGRTPTISLVIHYRKILVAWKTFLKGKLLGSFAGNAALFAFPKCNLPKVT